MVPEGGQLSITAGGMPKGHGTCGLHESFPNVPEGGEQELDWMLFAPFGDDGERAPKVRRFHALRAFHQRLLRVRPLRGRQVTLARDQLNK